MPDIRRGAKYSLNGNGRMLGAPLKAEQGGICRRGQAVSSHIPSGSGAGQEPRQGGLQRAAAARIIRQELICKENFAPVRANIDFVFVCFCRA